MLKTYTCPSFPELRIGPVKFMAGSYSTEDEKLQALIEKNKRFGSRIFDVTQQVRRVAENPSPGEGEAPPFPGAVSPRQGMTSSLSLGQQAAPEVRTVPPTGVFGLPRVKR